MIFDKIIFFFRMGNNSSTDVLADGISARDINILKYYGYIECDKDDKKRGRPYCASAADLEGEYNPESGYVFADDFTYSWQNIPCDEKYRRAMRKLIAPITDTKQLGSGNFWNPYFHCFCKKRLTKEYHDKVHEICKGALYG